MYLPRKPVQEFSKRQVIYDPQRPSDRLYVVILGRVKISRTSDDGGEVIARFASIEGFFGEPALVGARALTETAIALDDVMLMCWSAAEIEVQIERAPRLGLALSQYFVRHCIELQDRIESMASHKTPERVMLAIVQLADAMGTPMIDGSTRIGSLTHQTIAEYTGTSREIVTSELNRLRRLGMLSYTRKHIDVYTGAIRDVLRSRGIALPNLQTTLTHAAG
jgi:CRP-like cAMP-binding protein